MKQRSRATTLTVWVLQVVGAAAFLAAGIAKLVGAAPMVQLFDTIGVGQWFRYITGVIEVGGALLMLIPAAAVLGAVLLACTMVGAILTHIFILHTNPAAPAALLILVSAVLWLRRDQIGTFGLFSRATGRGAA